MIYTLIALCGTADASEPTVDALINRRVLAAAIYEDAVAESTDKTAKIAKLNQVLETDASFAPAHYDLAKVHLSTGNRTQACTHFRQFATASTDDASMPKLTDGILQSDEARFCAGVTTKSATTEKY